MTAPAADARVASIDEVLAFMGLIWAIDHQMERVSKRMETAIGLTIPQRLSLLLIGRRPGILASELATVLHLHRGTMSGIVGRLEDAGLVTRVVEPGDGRRIGLSLTPAGRRVNARRAGTFEAAVRGVLAASAPADLAATASVLARLSTELQAVADS